MSSTTRRDVRSGRSCGLVVLAAGLGSRLGTVTQSRPKALVEVQGHALLHWVLSIASGQLDSVPVVVVVGHLGDQIVRFLDTQGWTRSGVDVTQVRPIDTAVSLFAGLDELQRKHPLIETVISVNADTLVVSPLMLLLELHDRKRSYCTIAVTRRMDAQHPGSLGFDDDGLLTRCVGAHVPGTAGASAGGGHVHDVDSTGVIAWSVEALSRLHHLVSIERGLVPEFVRLRRAYAYDIGALPCIDCGTPRGLAAARAIDWHRVLAAGRVPSSRLPRDTGHGSMA